MLSTSIMFCARASVKKTPTSGLSNAAVPFMPSGAPFGSLTSTGINTAVSSTSLRSFLAGVGSRVGVGLRHARLNLSKVGSGVGGSSNPSFAAKYLLQPFPARFALMPAARQAMSGAILAARRYGGGRLQLGFGGRGASRYGRGGGGPGRMMLDSQNAVWLLLGINGGVFLMWNSGWFRPSWMYDHFTLSRRNVSAGRVHTMLTSTFSHYSFGHFAMNMITLYFFGSQIAALVGARVFLQLYLGGGLTGSICSLAYHYLVPKSSIPASWGLQMDRPSLGASGAVNAVIMSSIAAFPRSTVYLMMVLPVPAALFGIGYVLYDAYGAYIGGRGVDNAAHLGGAAVGILFGMLLRRRMY